MKTHISTLGTDEYPHCLPYCRCAVRINIHVAASVHISRYIFFSKIAYIKYAALLHPPWLVLLLPVHALTIFRETTSMHQHRVVQLWQNTGEDKWVHGDHGLLYGIVTRQALVHRLDS